MCDEATDQSLDSLHVDALLKARQRAGNDGLSTTVRIFERNDYYYFFERDGELAAEKEGVYTFSNRPPVLWGMDDNLKRSQIRIRKPKSNEFDRKQNTDAVRAVLRDRNRRNRIILTQEEPEPSPFSRFRFRLRFLLQKKISN
jgi:hypothetical protein